MMFPEGTRSPDGRLRAFKHGAFTLAQRERVPLLPIVVEGTANALPKRGFVLRGRHAIRVRVLERSRTRSSRACRSRTVTQRVWQLFAKELGPERVAAA